MSRARRDEAPAPPILAVAERYLRVTGACMTPNTQRFTDLTRLIDECEVYGVLDLTWKFCAPFEIESHRVKELARGKRTPDTILAARGARLVMIGHG